MAPSEAEARGLKVIELITDKAREARRVPQQSEWAPALTVSQFLEREEGLAIHAFSVKGMKTWILINAGDEERAAKTTFGEDREEVNSVALSSLETFQQEAIGPGGVRGTAYAIASVFTEPHKRGKGYASTLLRGVLEKLREVDPRMLAADLFSDVGAPIYERSGFRASNLNPTVQLLRLAAEGGAEAKARKAAERVTWLSRREVAPVVERLQAEAELNVPEDGVMVLASPNQVDWFSERESLVAASVGKSALPAVGAVCGDACAVWFVDFSKASAPFTRILLFKGAGNEEDTAAVVAAVVIGARDAGCMGKDNGIWLWGDNGVLGHWPISVTSLAEAGVTYEEKPRVGYLPMMAPLHPSIDPLKWRYVPQALWV